MSISMQNPLMLFIFSHILRPDKIEEAFQRQNLGIVFEWKSFEPRGIYKKRKLLENELRKYLGTELFLEINRLHCPHKIIFWTLNEENQTKIKLFFCELINVCISDADTYIFETIFWNLRINFT